MYPPQEIRGVSSSIICWAISCFLASIAALFFLASASSRSFSSRRPRRSLTISVNVFAIVVSFLSLSGVGAGV